MFAHGNDSAFSITPGHFSVSGHRPSKNAIVSISSRGKSFLTVLWDAFRQKGIFRIKSGDLSTKRPIVNAPRQSRDRGHTGPRGTEAFFGGYVKGGPGR
jgi:hypothetical protein